MDNIDSQLRRVADRVLQLAMLGNANPDNDEFGELMQNHRELTELTERIIDDMANGVTQ
jgi:hypothetical protein